MTTVRQDLVAALEAHPLGFENHHPHSETPYDHECATCRFWRLGRDALDRARAEPEWLSQCCGAPPHEATPDVGADNPAGICGKCRENTGFARGEPEESICSAACDQPSEQHCLDCGCYQAGYQAGTEAQRERVGGGTA